MTSPSERLRSLGVELPKAPPPAGSYVPAARAGNLVFTAGQLPFEDGELSATGKVGADASLEEAQKAARLCAMNALAAVASYIHTRPDEARELLTDFAEFTRYAFRREVPYVTLADELHFGRAGARLHVLALSDDERSHRACTVLAGVGGGRYAELLRASDAPSAVAHVLRP